MEIWDAEIDWREDFGNPARLINYVNKVPNHTDVTFTGNTETGLWYGENEDGYASWFAWDGGQQDGYGGRHYELEMEDGSTQVLKGPWSSRAGVMNKAGFGPCMDVLYRTHEEQLGGRSGGMTVEKAEEVIDQYINEPEIPDYEVELDERLRFSNDEPYFIPEKTGGQS